MKLRKLHPPHSKPDSDRTARQSSPGNYVYLYIPYFRKSVQNYYKNLNYARFWAKKYSFFCVYKKKALTLHPNCVYTQAMRYARIDKCITKMIVL